MIKENIEALSNRSLFESAQNSLLLKEQGLLLLQNVCGQGWTDHNTGDPGITLLEVLAFVISDLGYRLDFPISELLALDAADDPDSNQQAFFLGPQILPSNTVTLADHRRAIIDILGVKNAEFLPVKMKELIDESNSATDDTDMDSGVVDILIDLEDDWSDKTAQEKHCLYQQIRQCFLSARNVNQDLRKIILSKKRSFSVAFCLAFENIDNLTDVIFDILNTTKQVFSPTIKKYSEDDLIQSGYAGDDVFDGPLVDNGFMLASDIERFVIPKIIYASDIFGALGQQAGLKRINSFSFYTDDSDDLNYERSYLNWRFKIHDDENESELADHVPKFEIEQSLNKLEIELDGQAYLLSDIEKQNILDKFEEQLELSQESEYSDVFSDFISGSYRELKQYTSIQDEFPSIYKLVESRLDGAINSSELANIMQLKGFLTLFDQVLADQFAQLDNLRKLLALPDQQVFIRLAEVFDKMLASENLSVSQISQFWQDVRQLPLTELSQPITNISGREGLLGDYFEQYQLEGFQSLSEPVFSEVQLDRLNRSLAHLLGRFAEQTLDANLLKYKPVFDNYLADFAPIPNDISDDQSLSDKLVALKQIIDLSKIINDYPKLSKSRSGGFNYLAKDIKNEHVGGLSSRLMAFLGYSHPGQMPLATNNRESVYLLESELLRFGADSEYQFNCLYFVSPQWPTRLQNDEFQALCQQQIGRQVPVHQTSYFIQLSRVQMSLFERVYYAWLNAMTQLPLLIEEVTDDSESVGEDEREDLINHLSTLLRHFVIDQNSLQIQILSLFEEDELSLPEEDELSLLEESGLNLFEEGELSLFEEGELSLFEEDELSLFEEDELSLFEEDDCPENLVCLIKPWLAEADRYRLTGASLAELIVSLNDIIDDPSSPDEYSHISSDDILNEICYYKIDQLINPYSINHGQIGNGFRIGFTPLDYLKISSPLPIGTINPDLKNTFQLTVAISEPNQLNQSN